MDERDEKAIADGNSDRRTNLFSTDDFTKNHAASHQQRLQELGKFLDTWTFAPVKSEKPALSDKWYNTPQAKQSLMSVSQVKWLNPSIQLNDAIHQKVWEA